MDKIDREKRKKKLKVYEKLGALKFQKVVFKVEELKFKILKKCCPNFIRYFDKYMDWKKKNLLKHAKTEEEIKQIKDEVKIAKMAMRKEWNEEKNRNYHMDPNRPTEIIQFLKWNKDVHKKGLIKDGILIPILIAGVVLQIPGTIFLLAYEVLSAAINFECINEASLIIDPEHVQIFVSELIRYQISLIVRLINKYIVSLNTESCVRPVVLIIRRLKPAVIILCAAVAKLGQETVTVSCPVMTVPVHLVHSLLKKPEENRVINQLLTFFRRLRDIIDVLALDYDVVYPRARYEQRKIFVF